MPRRVAPVRYSSRHDLANGSAECTDGVVESETSGRTGIKYHRKRKWRHQDSHQSQSEVTDRVPCLNLDDRSIEADSIPWAQHDVQVIRDLEANAINGKPCFSRVCAASMPTARGDGDINVRAVHDGLAGWTTGFPPVLPREHRVATASRTLIYATPRPASGEAFVGQQ